MSKSVKIIECPRDAMQGIHTFIPTDTKVKYLNHLLTLGFDTLDFGSFVSPKAIPQMRDTAQVLDRLDLDDTKTQLLAIVANLRGVQDAMDFDEITYLGYPFSVSETFQQRNTRKSIEESLELVENIQNLCEIKGKKLVVYISMAFGNPYGDPWDPAIVSHWVDRIAELDVEIVSLADTIGVGDVKTIGKLVGEIVNDFPKLEVGAHIHTTPDTWRDKVEIAYKYGCRRFDGALKGYGGCPMAKDDLTGNMPTEKMLGYFTEKNIETGVDIEELPEALLLALSTFP